MKSLRSCLFSLLFPLCLFLTTCTNPLNHDSNEEDGITRIAITLPGANTGSRVAGDPALMGYELTFQGPGGQSITKTASGGQTVTVRVEPGLWTVKVRSYDPATGVDEAKGEILSFDVKEGQTNKPSIQMRFVQTAPIAAYLASAGGSPVSLHLDLPLDGAAWGGLLGAIASAGKTVDLNLSACTGSGSGAGLSGDGTFDPDGSMTTGKDRIVSLALPDRATKIADGSWDTPPTFNGFSTLRSFSGAGINTIGFAAFMYCYSLALTSLPPNLITIGDRAFWRCTSLALTSLPANLTTIGDSAFSDCSSLALTSLPPNLTTIGNRAFWRCTSLALTSLPAGLTTIGESTFLGCSSLALTSLPVNLTTIGENAFASCHSLALTELPAGLTTIGDGAFRGTNLALTSLPAGLTFIGNYAFRGTNLALTSLPAGIKTIYNNTFQDCTSLTTLDLSNVTIIYSEAFIGCTSLVSVILGNGVSIDSTSFPGDLHTVYSGAGTYVHDGSFNWTKQP